MNEHEDEPFIVEIEQPPQIAYDDTATYAQTLSNSILALVQWEAMGEEERVFVRMQIKRLVDGQLALKELYLDREDGTLMAGEPATSGE